MRSFRDVSIGRKLVLFSMLTSSVALLVACGAFVAYELTTFRQTMIQDLSTLTEIIGANSTAALTFRDRTAAEATLGALRARPHIVAAGIYTTDGELFATYARPGYTAGVSLPTSDGYRFERGHLVLVRPVVLDAEALGTVYLQSDLQEMYVRLTRYVGIGAGVLLTASLIAFGLAFRLQRLIASPIEHLAQTARVVSRDKNYLARAVKYGQDELGFLTDSFNEMLAQIHERDVALQAARDDLERRVNERTAELQQEVAERRRALDALRISEERYRELFENANDIVYTYDLVGRFTSLNKAGEKITGYTQDEALGLDLSRVVAPEYLEVARRAIADKVTGKLGATQYEVEILAKDGRRIPVEVSSRLIYRDGVPVGAQGIARDMTDRRHLEEQLRLSHKMEAIGRLAAGIAHDFNNLLTAINGYSGWLLMRLETSDPMREDIEQIKMAGDRAATLTRQLLAFGRRQILRPVVLDLNTVVANMTQLLRRLIGEDVELVTALGPAVECVTADPGQIEQVIMNLALNARDAMPHGGRLIMETANVGLDEAYSRTHVGVRPGSYVMLAVTDTGSGMDGETKAHIFEPFFTTKPQGKGTGLGLSTVYGIVTQSGGHIWVYSEVGRGTSFKIYLPRVPARAELPPPPLSAMETTRGSETVLLVEDEELVRVFTRDVLQGHGYTVLEARHGREALAICERHKGRIHLLLTDIVMPEITGGALAQQLTRARPDTKTIFMSGYTDSAVIENGTLTLGAAFLQKPFAPDALMRKVRDVLDAAPTPPPLA